MHSVRYEGDAFTNAALVDRTVVHDRKAQLVDPAVLVLVQMPFKLLDRFTTESPVGDAASIAWMCHDMGIPPMKSDCSRSPSRAPPPGSGTAEKYGRRPSMARRSQTETVGQVCIVAMNQITAR